MIPTERYENVTYILAQVESIFLRLLSWSLALVLLISGLDLGDEIRQTSSRCSCAEGITYCWPLHLEVSCHFRLESHIDLSHALSKVPLARWILNKNVVIITPTIFTRVEIWSFVREIQWTWLWSECHEHAILKQVSLSHVRLSLEILCVLLMNNLRSQILQLLTLLCCRHHFQSNLFWDLL